MWLQLAFDCVLEFLQGFASCLENFLSIFISIFSPLSSSPILVPMIELILFTFYYVPCDGVCPLQITVMFSIFYIIK
jgi:hypothetical protein